ncbi:hypothetical protein PG994_003433 [Apiospora phragmitis]|uniref:serine C-palmitoyltransferase n=1 Tax=Apiospora phragmitis TaxID=2905665 RepID=A0ABR1W0T4_9PEZI
MDLHEAQTRLMASLNDFSHAFQKIPGSEILIRYIQSSYQNDPVRSAIELVLVIFFIRYLLSPSYATHGPNYVKLREDEIDELVKDWEPEPLVPAQTPMEKQEADNLPIIVGPTGPKTKLSNGKTVTNLASYNFYNFNANEQVKEKAIQTLQTYDVHMKTESDIATYLGTQSCIVYAQAFSTVSSVIPAFCKRGDIIIADKMVNFSIRKGLEASRSNIVWYNHNDMEDLERQMQKVVQQQAKKKLTRRFVVVEGLSNSSPSTSSVSAWMKPGLLVFLGRTGRGLTEAQNVDASQIDMITGSLAGPLCAGGGFCCANKDVVEHQRINAASYTFSAALPAMLAVTASETLNMLQSNPELLTQLRENIKAMRAQLDPRSDWVICTSVPENPIMIIVLKPEVVQARGLTPEDQERILQDCVEETLNNGVMVTKLKSLPARQSSGAPNDGTWYIQPAIKVCVTSGLSKKEIEKAGVTIRHAITKVMTRKTNRQSSVNP